MVSYYSPHFRAVFMRICRNFSQVFFLLALIATASSQDKKSVAPAKAPDYSQEGAVVEHYITRIAFEGDGSSVREVTAVAKAQSDAGVQQLAVLRFPYSSFSETVDVDYVRVRKADGSVVVTPAYNIQDLPTDLTREAPMYSDLHEKHITVKALGAGDTLEYLIRFRTTKAEFPGQFWFAHNFTKQGIIKDEQLEVSFPKDKYVNVSSTGVKPEIREENGRKIYLWKSSNLERKEEDKKELPKREAPRPEVELTTFHSWAEVGAWYASLQKDQIAITPDLQKKAAELTKGLTTDDEKIRALYNFVSTHFHYVSLSFGIGRYQPHAADDVLGNEYGDCKDKHTLLATMLKAVGIDAWPVLINSSRKIDEDLPAPSSFDHVITAVPRGDKILWLDTTPEVSPYALILTNLRGKEALVVPSDKPALLMKTPDTTPFPSLVSMDAEGKLGSDGVFTGHIERVTRGDIEVLLRAGYRQVPQAQWKELTQRLSYLSGFAGDVSEVKASSPEKTDEPFKLSYDYTRKAFGDWDNHRIIPAMPPMGIEVADSDERKPVEPFLLGALGDVTYHSKIELPSFSKAVAPADVNLTEDFAEYHAKYSIANGVLIADRKLTVKKEEVPVADWDKYVKFRKAVSDDENHWIDLDGEKSDTTATATGPKYDDTEAGQKFREAGTALQNRDISRAGDLVREVLTLNPSYEGAHATLGWIDFFQNRREDALAEIKKEEELSPTYVPSYTMGAWMYINMHRQSDAMDQWRKLLKAVPDNREAATKLAGLLMSEKKYAEAVTLLEPVVKAAPDSQNLQLTLAFAYLKNSQKDKALAIIQKTVNDHSDALTLNNVAYELGDAGVDFDTARKYSEDSIRETGALIFKTSLDDLSALQFSLSEAQYWDTLGWIYFRMGKFDKAISYLRPAWLLAEDSVIGDHLAQAYQKVGKNGEAKHTYELALAAVGGNGNRDEIREHYKQLIGKLPPEEYSTHRLPNGTWTMTPAEELGRMRSVKVAVQSAPSGNATFVIAFDPGKVAAVVYMEGATELKPFAEKIENAKFNVPFPDDGIPTRVVRRGILSCHSGSCDFTLMPQNAAFVPQTPQF
jgi:tetratricopeptide (TPR) repeat protein